MSQEKSFEEWRREMEEQMNADTNWVEAGDIVVPSGNIVHVYWNVINWNVAIKYEDKKAGGNRRMILQRAGEMVTASSLGEASIVADRFYGLSH